MGGRPRRHPLPGGLGPTPTGRCDRHGLVRQLVERQCVRRMEQGDLSDEQVETLGLTLMRLEDAMNELCERFGLSPSDLNLDLGPLGTLLPQD
ncbi:gas vesicle protein K [Nonomuraea sp. ZG12]|uniref:gas vesicle protein K n=1 Tax=Nonomuraea sp. ZG12 TaxID=3452207 RepID=UPI003F89C65F